MNSIGLEQYVTMEEHLKGRRCIITGSSGTIGKILATFIASRGGIPILVDVVPQDATVEAVASYGGEYSAHRVDLSDVAQIKSFYAAIAEQHDGLDILINNAGLLSEVKLLDMTEDNWDRVLNVNAKGAAFMSQGAVGLMQAAARFEPEREVRFSTYASWWIRSAMQDYVLRNWSIVRTGSTSSQKSLFFNLRRLRARIEARTGRPLDDRGRSRIAAELKVAPRDVETMEGRLTGADRSLDAPVGEDGDESWVQFLADGRASPEDNAMERIDGGLRARRVREALDELPEREAMIVRERLLEDETRTLESLGQELGVSKERVRQLEARALAKLRRSLESFWRSDGNAQPGA